MRKHSTYKTAASLTSWYQSHMFLSVSASLHFLEHSFSILVVLVTSIEKSDMREDTYIALSKNSRSRSQGDFKQVSTPAPNLPTHTCSIGIRYGIHHKMLHCEAHLCRNAASQPANFFPKNIPFNFPPPTPFFALKDKHRLTQLLISD